MKIKDLIEKLSEIMGEYGNLKVVDYDILPIKTVGLVYTGGEVHCLVSYKESESWNVN